VYFDRDRLGRHGFTLVELMVSMVLGAILIGAVLNFVTGQTRIATAQSGREEVQQNARGALEMVASDLRGAVSAGVVRGDANSIEFLLPRRWGVVCSQTGTTTTYVVFPDIEDQVIPEGVDAGLLFKVADNDWRPVLPTRATVTDATEVDVSAACGNQRTAGSVVAYKLDGVDHPAGMARGSTVALYQRVKYSVQTSRGEPWIHRSNGMTNAATFSMQPLAGPVDAAAGGISFTYFTGTPPVELNAPPGAGAPAAGLSQVRLRVRMKSAQGGSNSQVEFDSATVQIRNDN
jgi:prepilin-type N-terminal cleavage/methylation domain-containing protein